MVRVGLLYIDYDHIHIGYFASIMSEFIYHEKQAAALCGVHCLNNLLQGPYLNAGVLADIAHELDAAERKLMFSLKFIPTGRRGENCFLAVMMELYCVHLLEWRNPTFFYFPNPVIVKKSFSQENTGYGKC